MYGKDPCWLLTSKHESIYCILIQL